MASEVTQMSIGPGAKILGFDDGSLQLNLTGSKSLTVNGGQLSINSNGIAGGNSDLVKQLLNVLDGVSTTVATVTVPNATAGAGIRLTITGTQGDGDSTVTAIFNLSISRIAGAATKFLASAAVGSVATVGATSTLTIAVTPTGLAGANGATQTFTINVTLARSAGASTNHSLMIEIELYNQAGTAAVPGITVA
jgi:hypothetical protein